MKDDGDKRKFPTKTLLGGVITEDRKIGSGATAKSGAKVGIRYIGKLKMVKFSIKILQENHLVLN